MRGWFTDPVDARWDRFWEGAGWTRRTRRSGAAATVGDVLAGRAAFAILVALPLELLTPVVAELGVLAVGQLSWTRFVVALTGVWAVINLVVMVWLGRRFRGRPFGGCAAPWSVAALCYAVWFQMTIGLVQLAAAVPAVSMPGWSVAAWWAAWLPVPVWAVARRRRYPRWAPLDRENAGVLTAAGVAMLAFFLPISHGAAAWALLPLPVAAGVAWLRAGATPSFTMADRAQPWWPRTPGRYPDVNLGRGSDRLWDGSRWWDGPDRDRRVRRKAAWTWTGWLIAVAPITALAAGLAAGRAQLPPDVPGSTQGPNVWTGPSQIATPWALLVVALAVGAVAAWRGLHKPLPPEAGFPPAGRPLTIANAGWLRNPDDPTTWRYWDGRAWTGSTAPIVATGTTGSPETGATAVDRGGRPGASTGRDAAPSAAAILEDPW